MTNPTVNGERIVAMLREDLDSQIQNVKDRMNIISEDDAEWDVLAILADILDKAHTQLILLQSAINEGLI